MPPERSFIHLRAALGGVTAHDLLLCTLRGGPMSTSYVRAMTKRLAKRAGVSKRCNPHRLRHTHATELVKEGATLPEVQAQLGHSSLAVTSRYLHHVTGEDLAELARRRPSWRAQS